MIKSILLFSAFFMLVSSMPIDQNINDEDNLFDFDDISNFENDNLDYFKGGYVQNDLKNKTPKNPIKKPSKTVENINTLIKKLSDNLEKDHKKFNLRFNAGIAKAKKLYANFTNKQNEFVKITKKKADLEASFLKMKKEIENMKEEYEKESKNNNKNSKEIAEYNNEKALLQNLSEHVRIFKDYKQHCLCNITKNYKP